MIPLVPLALASALAGAEFEEQLLDTVRPDLRRDGSPVFAPTGDRVAYMAVGTEGSVVVVDGEPGKAGDFADAIVFSRDGKHVAHRLGKRVSKTAERWTIVLDGEPGKSRDWVGPPSFTADGEKVAYWAGRGVEISREGPYEGGEYFIVFGGKKQAAYKDGRTLDPPVLSADGKVAAGVAIIGTTWHVVYGGRKKSKGFPMIGRPALSADGKKFVARARVDRGWSVVDEKGRVLEQHEFVSEVILGAGGRRACLARDDGKWGVFVNKKPKGKGWDYAGSLVFSPDAKRTACVTNVGGELHGNWPPGMEPSIDSVGIDGRPFFRGGRWSVAVDGKRGAEFDRVRDPIFSPDGKAVAYAAREDGKWIVVAGEARSAPFDEVAAPVFSADGARVGFGARDGKELWWKVLDLSAP